MLLFIWFGGFAPSGENWPQAALTGFLSRRIFILWTLFLDSQHLRHMKKITEEKILAIVTDTQVRIHSVEKRVDALEEKLDTKLDFIIGILEPFATKVNAHGEEIVAINDNVKRIDKRVTSLETRIAS